MNALQQLCQMNILVETCKLENCHSIDPFDLVDKQIDQFEAVPSCNIDLDEYLDDPNMTEVQSQKQKTNTFEVTNCRNVTLVFIQLPMAIISHSKIPSLASNVY